jgi:hypothetical protein
VHANVIHQLAARAGFGSSHLATSQSNRHHRLEAKILGLMPSTEKELEAFILRHKELLVKERDAEVERSSLLLSNCGPKLLEKKGLALNGLGVVGINIGLGGKTCVTNLTDLRSSYKPI